MNSKLLGKAAAAVITGALIFSGAGCNITNYSSSDCLTVSAASCLRESSASLLNFEYSAHVQTYGWQDTVKAGMSAGTTGQSKRLEAVKINSKLLRYRSYTTASGWQGWKTNNQISGSTGQSKAIEAFQIEITDNNYKEKYNIYYRVHMRGLGWSSWCKNGQTAGTTGQSRRLEAIQIILIPKSDDLDRYSELLDSVITGDCQIHCTGYIEFQKVGSNGVIDAILRALGLI